MWRPRTAQAEDRPRIGLHATKRPAFPVNSFSLLLQDPSVRVFHTDLDCTGKNATDRILRPDRQIRSSEPILTPKRKLRVEEREQRWMTGGLRRSGERGLQENRLSPEKQEGKRRAMEENVCRGTP